MAINLYYYLYNKDANRQKKFFFSVIKINVLGRIGGASTAIKKRGYGHEK